MLDWVRVASSTSCARCGSVAEGGEDMYRADEGWVCWVCHEDDE
jgi:transposase